MVSLHSEVEVIRNNIHELVDATSIVPGDVVVIHAKSVIPADLIVISGKCIVSEAMLTGESVPVMKEAIREDDPRVLSSKHILY